MFRGCTFEEQQVNSKDDGGLYREIFRKDGILWGCEMTVTNTALTIQPGRLIISGRMIPVDGATQIPFTSPIQNGYGQVLLTIDLSKTATKEEFDQVEASVVYSTTSLFPELTQGEINTSNGDMIYQQELAVVSIAGGNITGITRQIGGAEIDAEKLGGQPPEYYATKAEVDSKASASNPTFSGRITANAGIRLPDGEKVSWGTGWGAYANDASSFYIATPTGHNKYLFFGVSENAWALLPNSTTQLGTGNFRRGQIYSTNATISTSDLKDKKDIVLMTEEQARPFIMALKPCLYKLIDGTSGRTHYGLIAQEVEEAMRECGISDMEFAGFIKSPKVEREQVGTTKDGAPIYRDKVIEGEYVYGLRYEEFIAPIISVAQSLMQENEVLKGRMDELEKRIEALEAK